ncbi:hypothetical protein, partial [Oryzibacter oryziterrae]|uniref:hypothetical protein n=1 Tax=Oryzibacter oryziterrae TaxID=2766474 RepID=UPI001F23C97B
AAAASTAASRAAAASSANAAIAAAATASRAAVDAAATSLAAADMWQSISQDCSALVIGQALHANTLWPNDAPRWAQEAIDGMNDVLLADGAHWEVFVNWYRDRLEGDAAAARRGRPAIREMDIEIATIPDEVWKAGPERVLGLIKEIQDKYWGKSQSNTHIEIPAPRPAAIEPEWLEGQLVLPAKPVPSDLSKTSLDSALIALKQELQDLVGDARQVHNIDQRSIDFLERLTQRLPLSAPTEVELFRIAHTEQKLQGYVTTVNDEWPGFLAVSYASTLLAFDRTLRQFPAWRSFLRNAADARLSNEEVAAAPQVAIEFAEALRVPEIATVVDQAIPEALNSLAALAQREDWQATIDVGAQDLAADLIESVSNILKNLAIPVLGYCKGKVVAAADWAKELKVGDRARNSLGKALQDEADNFGPNLIKLLKKMGKWGPAIAGAYHFGALDWFWKLLELLERYA